MNSSRLNQLMTGLTADAKKKHFKAGEVIVTEHSRVQSIPMLIQGSVKVVRIDDDRELVLYYLQPGEACVMSFMAGMFNDIHNVRMVAEEACDIAFIPIDSFQTVLREHPDMLTYMFQIYHKRFGELLDLVDAVAFRKMDERLLQFLEKRAELSGSRVLTITHEQLAQELGTAREVVSRLLKQMETKGLLELGRNRIQLM
jgi:CRP/FNR family transcriptional regulator, anaerobic regulatory protein